MKFLLTALLLCTSCGLPAGAVDMSSPARWDVSVQDAAGRPLPSAAVTLDGQTVRLDAQGAGQAKAGRPASAPDISWTETLRVTLPGYLPDTTVYSSFPGARFQPHITLQKSRTTTIHLRDAQHRPLAGVVVWIGYGAGSDFQIVERSQRTDAHGQIVWTHPPLPSGFSVVFPGHGPRTELLPDNPSVTVTLAAGQVPDVPHARPLRLRLLAPDGSPAVGWTVGSNARVVNVWATTGGLNGPMHYVYQTDTPLPVGAEGVVKFAQSENHFIVFSPQGVPLLYPLHPQTWPKGEHHVTLRLPPVRRVQAGQLRNPDGTPAANVPICVSEATTGGTLWQVRAGDAGPSYHTDAQGRYALPQYFGTSTEYEAQEGSRSSTDLAAADSAVLPAAAPPLKPEAVKDAYKEVTLTVVGGQGQPLPEFSLSGNLEGGGYVSPLMDTVGTHLFVPRTARRVTVTAAAQDWRPLVQTLELTGTDDQRLTLTVPQSQHLKPLRGIILAPDGSPVSGVSLDLLGVNPNPASFNQNYAGFSTKTDEQGRFTFAAAPDAGEIKLYRFGTDDQPNLPGWTDPPAITPDTRQMTVRLKPVGSVRALLPATLNALRDTVYLKGKDYFNPLFSRTAHTLHWSAVPPGTYTLETQKDLAVPVTVCTVTVRAGRETVVDLRSRTTTFPAAYVPAVVRFDVNGTAGDVSGVTVTLWTERQRSGWDAALPADLTDDSGSVWLPLGVGELGVAVAHLPGRRIGWHSLTGALQESSSFGMSPAKTLTVHLPALPLVDGKAPYDTRQVWVRPAGPLVDNGEAVFLVLGFGKADAASRFQVFQLEGNTWRAEDLPPGKYHLDVESDVTLPETGPAGVDISP